MLSPIFTPLFGEAFFKVAFVQVGKMSYQPMASDHKKLVASALLAVSAGACFGVALSYTTPTSTSLFTAPATTVRINPTTSRVAVPPHATARVQPTMANAPAATPSAYTVAAIGEPKVRACFCACTPFDEVFFALSPIRDRCIN